MNKKVSENPELEFTHKKYIKIGMVCVILGCLFTYFWLIRAELSSAAIAGGVVGVEGNRATVAHLEGGIVEKVLVSEGDMVKAGEPLIELASVAPKAQLAQLELRYFNNLARKERLESQRKGDAQLIFSERLIEAKKRYGSLASVLETQTLLFTSKQESLSSQLAVLDTRLERLVSSEKSYQKQTVKQRKAYNLLEQELSMHEKLLKEGYSSQLQAIELKRGLALLAGDLAEIEGQLQSVSISKAEVKQQMHAVKQEYYSEIESELQDINQRLDEGMEQLTHAKDIADRVTITSPYSGQVVGLSVFSKGDVVRPGEPLMQIVPDEDRLIIEATIKPQDIDDVSLGQKAMVRLAAYNARTTPLFEGIVVNVAADRILEKERESKNPGFKIKVAIEKDAFVDYPEIKLHPGMPAEVYVLIKQRSPMDYLLEPLEIGLLRAFREAS
ncbi:HlyD family type I secretion periplasmic adaptor subunit [Vibrio sp. NTOU-M3]|uniref:HlyD family type I secretion periplasmic adaptor subunit n=1 Tax=unclassified Vibrio TaxID=2614977 RepID=UPI00349F8C1C